MNTGSSQGLRFAVVLPNIDRVPMWQSKALSELSSRTDLELSLVLKDSRLPTSTSYVYRLSRRLVCRPSIERTTKLDRGLGGVPQIELPNDTAIGMVRSIDADTARLISRHNVDFILDLGRDITGWSTLPSVRYGVWAFQFGENPGLGDQVLADHCAGRSTTRVRLIRLGDASTSARILASAELKTITHAPASTVNAVLSSAADWPSMIVDRIARGLWNTDDQPRVQPLPVRLQARTIDALRLWRTLVFGVAARLTNPFFRHNEWNIGLVRQPIQAFLEPSFRPEIEWNSAPSAHSFRADPFGVLVDGIPYVFYEHLDYRDGLGTIRCNMPRSSSFDEEINVDFGTNVHLSYPYVFAHEDAIYCVPETHNLNEIALYRALEFPVRWERYRVLVPNFAGVDTTVFRWKDGWWLMCGNQLDGPNEKLFVFHADDLRGPWKSHPGNPVKTDARNSRPGGTPFVVDGKLYRPAQDSSRSYGNRVVMNEVTTLTENDFSEHEVAIVHPFSNSQYPAGVHTISSFGQWTLIDARRSRFDFKAFRGAVGRALTRATRRLRPAV